MDATNSARSYTRGPYKRSRSVIEKPNPVYRSKVRAQENNKDCEEIFEYLKQVRLDIKEKFELSFNRSKTLENLQGVMDMLAKQIKKKHEDNNETALKEISILKDRIKSLEQTVNENKSNEEHMFKDFDLDINFSDLLNEDFH